MKSIKYSNIVFLAIIGCLYFNISGCSSIFRDNTVIIPTSDISFKPETGNSYNIEWPGPPREPLDYNHVKFYIPQLDLNNPATGNYLLRYKIKAERVFWDKQIGEFEAVYNAGQTKPTIIRYATSLQEAQSPANAPAETTGKFWLGCTIVGNVKGNIDRHSNRTVVYLEEENRRLSANTVLVGRKSQKHTIKCIDFGAASPQQSCATNTDCGERRLCIGGICKPNPLLGGRSCRSNDDCTDLMTEGPCLAIRNGEILGECEDHGFKSLDAGTSPTGVECRCMAR